LMQATNYVQQEPYSALDIERAQQSLLTFLRRNGYFAARVTPEVEVDQTKGLADVRFRVDLNKIAKFGDITFNGATPEESEHLKDRLGSIRARLTMSAIREGKDYSLKNLDNATAFLESHLQNENHLAAQVKLSGASYHAETNRADIMF